MAKTLRIKQDRKFEDRSLSEAFDKESCAENKKDEGRSLVGFITEKVIIIRRKAHQK